MLHQLEAGAHAELGGALLTVSGILVGRVLVTISAPCPWGRLPTSPEDCGSAEAAFEGWYEGCYSLCKEWKCKLHSRGSVTVAS